MSSVRWPVRVLAIAAIIFAGLFFIPVPNPPDPVTPIPFSSVVDGVPAHLPCGNVLYTVNLLGAPKGVLEDIQAAADEISAATGLRLRLAGMTTRTPQANDLQNVNEPQSAPVTIAWGGVPGSGQKPESSLLGDTSEQAGKTETVTQYRQRHGYLLRASNIIIAADVVIRIQDKAHPLNTLGGQTGEYAVILHELGHAVGLDHAPQSSKSIMEPELNGTIQHLTSIDKQAFGTLYADCLANSGT